MISDPPTRQLIRNCWRAWRKSFGRTITISRHLIRTIVNSRTYQLSGRPNATNRGDRTNYSHAQPRALDAEVLLDAICDVTGVPEVFTTGVSDASKMNAQAPPGTRAIQLREPDLFFSRFLELYGRPNRLTLPERNGKANLGQALAHACRLGL